MKVVIVDIRNKIMGQSLGSYAPNSREGNSKIVHKSIQKYREHSRIIVGSKIVYHSLVSFWDAEKLTTSHLESIVDGTKTTPLEHDFTVHPNRPAQSTNYSRFDHRSSCNPDCIVKIYTITKMISPQK